MGQIAAATREIWKAVLLLLRADTDAEKDHDVQAASAQSVRPLQQRSHVERYRDAAFSASAMVCRWASFDDAEFVFATVVLLIKALPFLLTDEQIAAASSSIAARVAVAAAVSCMLKFYSDAVYDYDFTSAVLQKVLTAEEIDQCGHRALYDSMHSCEATIAFRGGLFCTATKNVLIKSKANTVETLRLGKLDASVESAWASVCFYVAFHNVYDIEVSSASLGSSALSMAVSLAAHSCVREAGYAGELPFPASESFLVETAAVMLDVVCSAGPLAQDAVGGVFTNAQRKEYFMTLPPCVAAAALALRRELV